MSLQELGSLMFHHHNEHQLHFIEELEMKVVVILHEGHPCPKLQNDRKDLFENILYI
jgi:hypothetical protein